MQVPGELLFCLSVQEHVAAHQHFVRTIAGEEGLVPHCLVRAHPPQATGSSRVSCGTQCSYPLATPSIPPGRATEITGSTWTAPTGVPPGGYRSCVAAVSGTIPPALIAVGASGSDVSPDGGQSWIGLGETGFHVVAASSDGAAVWAAGSDGRIARLRR